MNARTALYLFAALMALTGFVFIGYGVMVGFGGGINEANRSNSILSWATPAAIILWAVSGCLAMVASLIKK